MNKFEIRYLKSRLKDKLKSEGIFSETYLNIVMRDVNAILNDIAAGAVTVVSKG